MFDCIMFQGNKIKKEVDKRINSKKNPKKGKMKEKMGGKKKGQVGNGMEPPWTTFLVMWIPLSITLFGSCKPLFCRPTLDDCF